MFAVFIGVINTFDLRSFLLNLYCFPLFLLPPQVHALNILRALFRDARLGENVMPYVADGIQAAILGFTSPIWAVS